MGHTIRVEVNGYSYEGPALGGIGESEMTLPQKRKDADQLIRILFQRLHDSETRLAAAERGRDVYRAVLEGEGYRNLDELATKDVDNAKELGEATQQRTKSILDRLKAYTAALPGPVSHKDCPKYKLSDHQGIITLMEAWADGWNACRNAIIDIETPRYTEKDYEVLDEADALIDALSAAPQPGGSNSE